MRIAVYSGSFDPLHIGHRAILECLSADRRFDWTYLVVSPQNPFKDPEKAVTASRRYADAVEALRRCPGLYASADDIELGMEPPQYTVNTLDALCAREPGNEFTLVIGADNLHGLAGWHEAGRLLAEYCIAVYPRTGYDPASDTELLRASFRDVRGISLLDAPIVDISSTRIREGMAAGLDMSRYMM